MKLIIDIPESIFNTIQADEMISREQLAILQMHILNGTPLDDVKAEIEEKSFELFEYDVITTEEIFEIIDNIGKAESEVK